MSQIIRLSFPKTSPMNGMSSNELAASSSAGMRGMSDGVPSAP